MVSLTENYNLKWDDFPQNLAYTFKRLRKQSRLFDVTLVSNDYKRIEAHKLVLSASSEFFNEIFANNTHSHPFLYLDTVTGHELNLVLDYLYEGEVNIDKTSLGTFLAISSKLRIEGLQVKDLDRESIENDNDDENLKEKDPVKDDTTSHEKDPMTHDTTATEIVGIENDLKVTYLHKESKYNSKWRPKKPPGLYLHNVTPELQQIEIDQKFDEHAIKIGGKTWKCTVCNKQMDHKNDLKKHFISHMSGLKFECDLCGKTLRTPPALINHKKNKH